MSLLLLRPARPRSRRRWEPRGPGRARAGLGGQDPGETRGRGQFGGSLAAALEARLGQLSRGPMCRRALPKVLVVSGPSGVGKDAVIRRLQERRPDLHFVVTATSRAPREGEVDGVDYHFVGRGQFEEWVERGELLEHAVVYGEYKGIPRAQVEAALKRGTDAVLRIDVQGAATVRRLIPQAVSVFIVAESEAALVRRLVARKTEPMDNLMVRVETARAEVARLREFDHVVVNREGELDACVDGIVAIIEAERSKVHQEPVKL